MSVVLVCDVCESQHAPDHEVSRVIIPALWLDGAGEEEGPAAVDVCSPECLANMGALLLNGEVAQADEPESQETVAGPAPEPQDDGMARERFSSIPETARVQYQDPTGVRIKTLGGHQ